ncbi:CBS domain-containing protein [Herbaspirillum robiniae]|uniref:CBS domain-containing protein n=1 Tax=Herbaspirillum robiniae TaxID=2014887 RepID=A0A246WUI8_9BURK|nr:CBS domain-containing protein [Herbaspirillum robiniae]NUU01272.1 CBS domain-containing protein [Herbaspirillum robiniae]OWY30703.1 CBS domain-containing protein [Herbaspirillum robiniae]
MHATRTIADVMTRGAHTLKPEDSVILAAQAMDELDVGVLPVCEDDRLVGLVTDRDIVLRAVAKNRMNDALALRDVMSHEVVWCYEDEPVDDVLDDMVQRQIRRLPVMDRQKRLVGIVSLGDVAAKTQNRGIGGALGEISLPAAPARRRPNRPRAGDDELPEVVNADLAEVNLGRS